jgi:hypothetical protein
MKDTAITFLLVATSALSFAQAVQEDPHPPGTAPASASATAPPAGDAMADQMRKMQEMHARMQAAKGPSERRALADEQLQLMQSGMEMMSRMGGRQTMGMGMGAQGTMGGPPAPTASPGAPSSGPGPMGGMMGMGPELERRMTMMEQMMQMMVDREAAMPRK